MSKFTLELPTPKYSIGDIVETSDGIGKITNIRICINPMETISVRYLQLNQWCDVEHIIREWQPKPLTSETK